MTDEPKKTIDTDALLAFREGLLDADKQQQIEERLRFLREDRDQLAAFDRDLDFMKSALVNDDAQEAAPDLWAIRRKVRANARRKYMVRVSVMAAAALVLVSAGFVVLREGSVTPASQQAAGDDIEVEYLSAAVTQMEYEVALLRAQIASSADAPSETELYADTATVLLEAARYWDRAGGDPEMSKVRYAEILAHFPDSAAAAIIVNEKPAALFGSKPL